MVLVQGRPESKLVFHAYSAWGLNPNAAIPISQHQRRKERRVAAAGSRDHDAGASTITERHEPMALDKYTGARSLHISEMDHKNFYSGTCAVTPGPGACVRYYYYLRKARPWHLVGPRAAVRTHACAAPSMR